MSSGKFNAYGSYIQLSTLDEKDKVTEEPKPHILGTVPYRRFICTKRDTIIAVMLLALTVAVITTTLVLGLPRIEEKRLQYLNTSFKISPSPLQSFQQAVVLSDGNECAAIGKSILLKNGSAVDSALATLFCNGVVTMQSMGLGGGFFMVVYSKKDKTSEVIDARETAPAFATVDMFHSNSTLSFEGGLSIAVPGELKGYWAAYQKYGNLSWAELIEPAIELCENGFTVSKHLAKKLKIREQEIMNIPSMREEFLNNATNELYKEGEIMKRPVLGRTLKVIAVSGADALYDGELTRQFLQDISDCGGNITEADLQNYAPKFRESVKVEVKGDSTKIWHITPPPASGVVASMIINTLSGYNFNHETMKHPDNATLAYHRMVEAFKFAFAQREKLGDGDFVNVTQIMKDIVSQEYAEKIRQKISDVQTYPPQHYESELDVAHDDGTAHVSVVAPNGDAVSVTSTINSNFGSLCRSSSTGIILNNNMDDFSSPNITNQFGMEPSVANFIEPGKRPLSSMCPSILVNEDGSIRMVLGGMGGTRIITATVQVMMRVLWLNETVKEATDSLRLHHQLNPNYIQYENQFPKLYLDRLKKYGHQIKSESQGSEVLCILQDESTGQLHSIVDYRKSGSVEGF